MSCAIVFSLSIDFRFILSDGAVFFAARGDDKFPFLKLDIQFLLKLNRNSLLLNRS
ncbi:hypothetical protein [Halocatena halophila]|uniref:hypothetical protein n=1 Tax=Halocatena halophila TaxID=2814576 RepID=UPI002ED16259